MIIATNSYASKDKRFSRLENALKQREYYQNIKEKKIDKLKALTTSTFNNEELLSLYDKIYREYSTYRFDSAMHFVDKSLSLASEIKNQYYKTLNKIHKSILLSTSGHFSESIANLNEIKRSNINSTLILEYYLAYEWAYRVWSEYSSDKVFSPKYHKKEMSYQDSILMVIPKDSKEYYFWKGENLYRKKEYYKAREAYFNALKGTRINTRLYARSMFGLAMINARLGKWDLYEEYMTEAAISDQINPLKENLALQELALFIYENNNKDVGKANKYLDYSIDDAIFYNNRLRLLEISKKVPDIVYSYQEKYLSNNQKLRLSIIIIGVLFVGVLFMIVFIYRQMKHLDKQKKQLANINERLYTLNTELKETNNTREKYVSLFISLCAAYIEKLSAYQNLVRRKIKTNQANDLLKIANAAKLNENDSKEFFYNFDSAFLNLYPNFISEFNNLLKNGDEIKLKPGEILNSELRIYALIRLGITDSGEIANLLFYSTQTIYNYRSSVRAKSKNRETFEKDVQQLCQTI